MPPADGRDEPETHAEDEISLPVPVPAPRTPSREEKDAYPLGFYNSQIPVRLTRSAPVPAKRSPVIPADGDDDAEETSAAPRRPSLSSAAAAATPPPTTSGLSRSRTLTLLNLTKPGPPSPTLPEPDFNRPKPATKQRYVSAGGPAKLDERAEIPGPALAAAAAPSGALPAMPKEELFGRLDDLEFVRAQFGEEALARRSELTGLRPGGVEEAAARRERKDSSASAGSVGGRFSARLRRVFGRRNSELTNL
ncbi:hypothetical protein LTR91_004925 [Friedmanniomyces endolithicus]|uniref:Uncharacterized protein n=1 Tax=Friedmanniomyces endolithicus TaxID=329885 RepID=A0AAN6QXE4_9PEZI|nr:hypothetical protein LTS09_012419 [Friedmanniomyces endolithicus]KAK0273697.1 hypothetical protein LTR35_012134 [Friedmanniomyces endolithicus]KAK0284386.1 hypothetical protein LTS00_011343 [Friedmanniomyces endolithicus]KAK0307246.1 hypothetical protein LTR01_005892 [Friedmanniomyces endolithicus]KAK0825669.1 hypothetical protein LTR73_006823 [Friedmanniomyces endolithicus]